MARVRYATLVFALLTTTAFAQDVSHARHHRRHAVASHSQQFEARAVPDQQTWAQPPAPRYHESGNSCAPDRAEPVWGEGNSFLGYSCVPESTNGS
jgi:hypothetical protein